MNDRENHYPHTRQQDYIPQDDRPADNYHPGDTCPCEAVRELKKIVERHERELALGSTSFALIKQDLEHIKSALEKKDRFNTGLLSNIANIILTILLGYLAVRMGISG